MEGRSPVRLSAFDERAGITCRTQEEIAQSEGVEAVERFVRDIRRHPAGTGTMVRCSAVDMPDEWARYRWAFTTPDGGPRLAGTDVVHLRRNLIGQVIVFAGEVKPSGS